MKATPDSWIQALHSSPVVRRFASQIVEASSGKPILDVPCGSGRNAFVFSRLGCEVICIDLNLNRIRNEMKRLRHDPLCHAAAKLTLHKMDLSKDSWPFGDGSIGAIVNVHFLLPSLFPFFERSLKSGGYLLLETVPGHGGNYLQLPRAGELRAAFEESFTFEFYRERPAGPRSLGRVTVQFVAKRTV